MEANWGFVLVALALLIREASLWVRESTRTKELANNKVAIVMAAEQLQATTAAAAKVVSDAAVTAAAKLETATKQAAEVVAGKVEEIKQIATDIKKNGMKHADAGEGGLT